MTSCYQCKESASKFLREVSSIAKTRFFSTVVRQKNVLQRAIVAKRIIKLDEYNKKILAIVHKEADLSNQELAERVGLSPSACFQRKKALREAGYFFNFHCEMDLDRICEHVLAYVEFYLHSNTMPYKSAFESAIQGIPEFMDCLRISGDMDYISFTCFPNLTALKDACDTLSANDSLGIKRIEIRPILERTKWYLGYPLEKLKRLED